MTELNQNDKELLSFPDSKVLKMEIDLINKIVEIKTDFCWIDSYGGMASECRIIFKNWKSFDIYKYDSSTDKTIKLAENEMEHLDDIPVFTIEDDYVELEGYGVKNEGWFIYRFHQVEIEGTYGDQCD